MLFMRFPNGGALPRPAQIAVGMLLVFVVVGSSSATYYGIKRNQEELAQNDQNYAVLRAVAFGDALVRGAKFEVPDDLKAPVSGMGVKIDWHPQSRSFDVVLTGYLPTTCEFAMFKLDTFAVSKITVTRKGYDNKLSTLAHDCNDPNATVTITGQG